MQLENSFTMRKEGFVCSVIYGLLSMSPLVADGQTFASKELQLATPYRSKGWGNVLWKGGLIRTKGVDGQRTGSHYMKLEPGTGSLLRMDFVNGLTIGPEITLGYVAENQSRWELLANVEYAASRHAWMGEGALRYILPPSEDSWVELFGGRRTTDYDPEPLLSRSQRDVAAGLFAWNGGKLYEAMRIGLKARRWMSRDWAIEGAFWYEGRYEMANHRHTSFFGKRPSSNVPHCHLYDAAQYFPYNVYGSGYSYSSSLEYDNADFYAEGKWQQIPLLHWQEDHLWRADLTLEYTPHRVLVVADDLHAEGKSTAPTMRLKLKTAWDNGDGQWGGTPADYTPLESVESDLGLRYLCADFSIEQRIGRKKYNVAYFASAGFFNGGENVGLQDRRHFNASHFPWIDSMESSLTWFALLTNYEFSTDGAWLEAHGEYMRRYFSGDIGQYVQLHFLANDFATHLEASYGWQLDKSMRVGLSVGFDDAMEYDGIGLNLIIVP